MEKRFAFLTFITLISCQVTETINLNSDGSGNIEIVCLRDENSQMQLAGEDYSKEEKFKDTTYVFDEYIKKYNETFLKYKPEEQKLFQRYSNVKVHIRESSFEKEFKTTFSQDFNKAESIPDIYKTDAYAQDLKNNYAIAADEKYFAVRYTFDGTVFKRIVKINDLTELKTQQERIEEFKKNTSGFKLLQTFTLKYHFSRKIKSVSNGNAILSSDKKSLTIEFQVSDCFQNPENTSLEVVLEQKD